MGELRRAKRRNSVDSKRDSTPDPGRGPTGAENEGVSHRLITVAAVPCSRLSSHLFVVAVPAALLSRVGQQWVPFDALVWSGKAHASKETVFRGRWPVGRASFPPCFSVVPSRASPESTYACRWRIDAQRFHQPEVSCSIGLPQLADSVILLRQTPPSQAI